MLDDIKKMAMAALNLTGAEIDEARKALLTELSSADARAAAADAYWHPAGSTTRLENAVPSAQQKYSDHRDKLAQAAPKFVALILAAEVARERQADAEKMLALKWKANSATATGELPKELFEWFERLERHGVRRSFLGEFSQETVAIIADLIRWKARDARFRDPDNPWRAVLGIFANRVIIKPGRKSKASLSTAGTPTKPRHIGGDEHYMFNDIVRELPPPLDAAPERPAPPMIDCSIYPRDMSAPPAAPETAQSPIIEADAGSEDEVPVDLIPEPSEGQALSTASTFDEYALPLHISDEDANLLRAGAEQWVGIDSDWPFELRYVIEQVKGDAAAVIEAVDRAQAPSTETPFSYFVVGARTGGLDAGWSAYRDATIRRFAYEFATMSKWKDLRFRLGISW